MTTSCPRCHGIGRTFQHVPARDFKYGKLLSREELRQCSHCHGIGRIGTSLAQVKPQECFSSDYAIVVPKAWRPMSAAGHIHGIPSFVGKAIATDGVLVIIERVDGLQVIGHLESFIRDASPRSEQRSVPSRKEHVNVTTKKAKMLAEVERMFV